MRYFAFATALLALSRHIEAAPAVPYSVVDVDGGNGRPSGYIIVPTTIYATVTTPAAATTISVTITEHETTTSTVSVISTVTSTTTEILPTTIWSPAQTVPYLDLPTPAATTLALITTLIAAPTKPQASPSAVTYDDGQWHTSYPVKESPTVTTTLGVSTSKAVPPLSSTTAASASLIYRRAALRRRA